jgi:transcription initiation factor TFIID subunit 9B
MSSPNGQTASPRPTNGAVQAPTPPSSQPAILSTAVPQTSLNDSGSSKRPRDARLIHLILTNQGVTNYQERVPLQLLDFAYRYTSGVLQDALHLSAESYGGGSGAGKGASSQDLSTVDMKALRLSLASRLTYQYQPSLPKDFLLELAAERNKVALPPVRADWGLRLPPEKYCLTGVGWGLKEEWESEREEDEEPERANTGDEDEKMAEDMEGEDDDEEGVGRMEDVFGRDGNEEDREMEDA